MAKERGDKSSSAGEQTARSLFGLFACLLKNCLHQISLCVHFWCLTISFVSETRKKLANNSTEKKTISGNKIHENIIEIHMFSKYLIRQTHLWIQFLIMNYIKQLIESYNSVYQTSFLYLILLKCIQVLRMNLDTWCKS